MTSDAVSMNTPAVSGQEPSYGSSTTKRHRRRTKAQLAELDNAIVHAVAQEQPVTLRGVFYRVSSAGAVAKTENGYRAVGRRLLALRRNGRIPYSWITDGTRWISKPRTYRDVETMLNDAAASYRRMLWHDQNVDVHVFTEKDAISGVVLPITSQWDVPLGVLRGYTSETFASSMAKSITATDKPTFVYQLGDHDPSGVDAWRDFRRKVCGFLQDEDDGSEEMVHFERIAVTEEQIHDLNLPTRPTKRSDSRAPGFEGASVEVDAIPAATLREIVSDHITQHLDEHAYQITQETERQERDLLNRLVEGGWSE